MNPDNSLNNPSTPAENTSPVTGSQQKQSSSGEDEMFIIRPPEKKPLDKRSMAIFIALSVLGILLLLGVLIFALISSASGLANDYRRLSLIQVKKIDPSLALLAPSEVLNKRDIEQPIKTINLSQQSQPSLENVLVIGGLSARYTQTEELQKDVRLHYSHVDSYVGDLKKLIAFDDNLKTILTQEPNLSAIINPNDPLSARTVGGSYLGFSKNIESQATPLQMSSLKKQLVASYKKKSAIYLNWAQALEAGDMSSGARAAQELVVETSNITPLAQDENYVKLFNPGYQTLLKDQKTLKSQLASL